MDDWPKCPQRLLPTDGKWYLAERVAQRGPTATTAESAPRVSSKSPGVRRVVRMALATAVVVLGAGVAFPAIVGASGSSHDSAQAVARFCADARAMADAYARVDDDSAPAAEQLQDLRQILPTYENLAEEAPSAVHGDVQSGADELKAIVAGQPFDTAR